jgi:hypothetical protein
MKISGLRFLKDSIRLRVNKMKNKNPYLKDGIK